MFGEIEGTGYEVHHDDFPACIVRNARVERLWTGARWSEGPVWLGAARVLVWSDIPNDRMLRWDEETGTVAPFRRPSNNSNGNTLDRQGRIVTCEHRTRRVTRTEHDGRITVLSDACEGRRLNSPNDVVVHSDGSVWFSDPDYGIMHDYEGDRAPSEVGACHVYRIAPDGELTVVAGDFVRPNGLAFSPDESVLYVSDTGGSHMKDGPRHIRRRAVSPNGASLVEGDGPDIVATCEGGLFDGFRIDTEGRIWTSAPDGVRCYRPDGTHLGTIRIPEIVANVEFAGLKRNRLMICATTSLYSVFLTVNGTPKTSSGPPGTTARDTAGSVTPSDREGSFRSGTARGTSGSAGSGGSP